MSKPTTSNPRSRFRISLDVWAVITALLLAGVVRAGILKHVPW
jgi:hypothetical protein